MKYKRLLFAILLLATVTIAQSVYVAPTIPPLFTAADIMNSMALMNDLGSNYDYIGGLLLKHDKDLYSPTGAVGALQAGLNNVTAAVNGMAKPTVTIPLNTCTPLQPAVLNPNQVAQPSGVHGNLGGWKMMWISNPTQEMLSCPVNVTAQGYYYVLGAFISPTNGHTMHVEMPVGVNVSGELVVPNTGSWLSAFAQTKSPLPIALIVGTNTLVLNFETGGYDVGGFALVQQ